MFKCTQIESIISFDKRKIPPGSEFWRATYSDKILLLYQKSAKSDTIPIKLNSTTKKGVSPYFLINVANCVSCVSSSNSGDTVDL